MRIHKEYRRLENIEEVNIYDVHEKEFFIETLRKSLIWKKFHSKRL